MAVYALNPWPSFIPDLTFPDISVYFSDSLMNILLKMNSSIAQTGMCKETITLDIKQTFRFKSLKSFLIYRF